MAISPLIFSIPVNATIGIISKSISKSYWFYLQNTSQIPLLLSTLSINCLVQCIIHASWFPSSHFFFLHLILAHSTVHLIYIARNSQGSFSHVNKMYLSCLKLVKCFLLFLGENPDSLACYKALHQLTTATKSVSPGVLFLKFSRWFSCALRAENTALPTRFSSCLPLFNLFFYHPPTQLLM